MSDEVSGGDLVIIVPPFAALERPSLGPHILQAIARQAGFRVEVVYANMMLARLIGDTLYQSICYSPISHLLGEKLFVESVFPNIAPRLSARSFHKLSEQHDFRTLSGRISKWVGDLSHDMVAKHPRTVACTSSYQQILSSLAILKHVKGLDGGIVTLLGGANCEGPMAKGLASVATGIDYVFSGESERTLVGFLRDHSVSRLPLEQVIHGTPALDLDSLPMPDYTEYFEQFERLLPDSALARNGYRAVCYETSRGCWWGQKHHCTFCGLNGEGMHYRAKSPHRVLEDLRRLKSSYPTARVTMSDNIMPFAYFKSLLPELKSANLGLTIFYEQKANISFEKMRLLRDAGIREIQPGIEALSTNLLRRMRKGTTAAQNIRLLRYARSLGIRVYWNLLYAFPNDTPEEYEETLRLAKLMHHLQPPPGLCHLSIDRFSPYFEESDVFGIKNKCALDAYYEIFPAGTPIDEIAYHFKAEYEHAGVTDPRCISRLAEEVQHWGEAWHGKEHVPNLAVAKLDRERYVLIDTRHMSKSREIEIITKNQALAALTESNEETAASAWALERSCAVCLDGRVIPLAVGPEHILDEFEKMRAEPSMSTDGFP